MDKGQFMVRTGRYTKATPFSKWENCVSIKHGCVVHVNYGDKKCLFDFPADAGFISFGIFRDGFGYSVSVIQSGKCYVGGNILSASKRKKTKKEILQMLDTDRSFLVTAFYDLVAEDATWMAWYAKRVAQHRRYLREVWGNPH